MPSLTAEVTLERITFEEAGLETRRQETEANYNDADLLLIP